MQDFPIHNTVIFKIYGFKPQIKFMEFFFRNIQDFFVESTGNFCSARARLFENLEVQIVPQVAEHQVWLLEKYFKSTH